MEENTLTNLNATNPTILSLNIPKKRGRKPKGGKIVKNEKNSININIEKKNIILHLKCKLSDIKVEDITNYNPEICNVEPYTEDNSYELLKEELVDDKKEIKGDKQKKIIYSKLSELEKSLNTNNICKKSDCFWCTCSFDSPNIYIPSGSFKDKYNVYGCFCSPECACSYLFNEKIDDFVHQQFQKFSRGEFQKRAMFKIKNSSILFL